MARQGAGIRVYRRHAMSLARACGFSFCSNEILRVLKCHPDAAVLVMPTSAGFACRHGNVKCFTFRLNAERRTYGHRCLRPIFTRLIWEAHVVHDKCSAGFSSAMSADALLKVNLLLLVQRSMWPQLQQT